MKPNYICIENYHMSKEAGEEIAFKKDKEYFFNENMEAASELFTVHEMATELDFDQYFTPLTEAEAEGKENFPTKKPKTLEKLGEFISGEIKNPCQSDFLTKRDAFISKIDNVIENTKINPDWCNDEPDSLDAPLSAGKQLLEKENDIVTVGNCANCGVEYHIHSGEINDSLKEKIISGDLRVKINQAFFDCWELDHDSQMSFFNENKAAEKVLDLFKDISGKISIPNSPLNVNEQAEKYSKEYLKSIEHENEGEIRHVTDDFKAGFFKSHEIMTCIRAEKAQLLEKAIEIMRCELSHLTNIPKPTNNQVDRISDIKDFFSEYNQLSNKESITEK